MHADLANEPSRWGCQWERECLDAQGQKACAPGEPGSGAPLLLLLCALCLFLSLSVCTCRRRRRCCCCTRTHTRTRAGNQLYHQAIRAIHKWDPQVPVFVNALGQAGVDASAFPTCANSYRGAQH